MIASGLESVRAWHESWAWVVVISNALAGVWVLAANWVRPLRVAPMWWFVAAAEVTVFVQVTLGAVMVGKYHVPNRSFHAFYGFVAIIAVAIIYSYRAQMRHSIYLLYGLGSLFIMGLAIRAMVLHR